MKKNFKENYQQRIYEVIMLHRMGKKVSDIVKISSLSRPTVTRYLNCYVDLFEKDKQLTEEELAEISEQAEIVTSNILLKKYDYLGNKIAQ